MDAIRVTSIFRPHHRIIRPRSERLQGSARAAMHDRPAAQSSADTPDATQRVPAHPYRGLAFDVYA